MEDFFQCAAKALIFNDENNVLLLKDAPRFNKDAFWDLPGGRIQKGEPFEDALKREVKEETGIDQLDNIKAYMTDITTIRFPASGMEVGLFFALHTATAHHCKVTLSEEHVDYQWVAPEDAVKYLPQTFPKRFLETWQKQYEAATHSC